MSDEELTSRIARIEQQISFLLDREIEDDEQDELGDQPIDAPVVLSDTPDALFDIYDVDSAARTFYIRGHSTYEVAVAGSWENIDTVSGFSTSGVNFLASALGSGADTYFVYIIVQRTLAGATVTLKVATDGSADTPDDDEEIYPLWQLTVASETLSVTMDLRGTKHWVAGA